MGRGPAFPSGQGVGCKTAAGHASSRQQLQGPAYGSAPQAMADQAQRRALRKMGKQAGQVVCFHVAATGLGLHVGARPQHHAVGRPRPDNQAEWPPVGLLLHQAIPLCPMFHGPARSRVVAVDKDGRRHIGPGGSLKLDRIRRFPIAAAWRCVAPVRDLRQIGIGVAAAGSAASIDQPESGRDAGDCSAVIAKTELLAIRQQQAIALNTASERRDMALPSIGGWGCMACFLRRNLDLNIT